MQELRIEMSYPVDEHSDRLLRHWAESNGEKDEANSLSEENLWPRSSAAQVIPDSIAVRDFE